jgi:hypothetical protein
VAYRQSYASHLQPLQRQLLQGQRQWVHLLDAVIGKPGWTKAERALLRELLCEAAGELLEGQGEDAVLKALYDKHAELDFDTEQREAHTALMQRVNQAYEAQDLLTLLELQLQIEQIDAGHMAGASEAKVKHYNKVLGEQLAELKAEIESVEMTFRMEFGLHPGWGLNPAKLGMVLEQTRQEWQADLAHRLQQHRMLEDQAATKRWLKSVRKQRREEAYDDLPF